MKLTKLNINQIHDHCKPPFPSLHSPSPPFTRVEIVQIQSKFKQISDAISILKKVKRGVTEINVWITDSLKSEYQQQESITARNKILCQVILCSSPVGLGVIHLSVCRVPQGAL